MSEAKRRAQDPLFTAIADQAETNMKSALRSAEKAALLHELAEAYRLSAGTTAVPNIWTAPNGQPAGDAEHQATPANSPTKPAARCGEAVGRRRNLGRAVYLHDGPVAADRSSRDGVASSSPDRVALDAHSL